MPDEGDDSVQRARDAERLKALEDRLAQARRDDRLAFAFVTYERR